MIKRDILAIQANKTDIGMTHAHFCVLFGMIDDKEERNEETQ